MGLTKNPKKSTGSQKPDSVARTQTQKKNASLTSKNQQEELSGLNAILNRDETASQTSAAGRKK
jgi:hypothetical protein